MQIDINNTIIVVTLICAITTIILKIIYACYMSKCDVSLCKIFNITRRHNEQSVRHLTNAPNFSSPLPNSQIENV